MAYKISAAARDAYAAMDEYIDYMNRCVRPTKRVYITDKQHYAICTHLTRVKQGQTKRAGAVKEFTEYRDCEVVIKN